MRRRGRRCRLPPGDGVPSAVRFGVPSGAGRPRAAPLTPRNGGAPRRCAVPATGPAGERARRGGGNGVADVVLRAGRGVRRCRRRGGRAAGPCVPAAAHAGAAGRVADGIGGHGRIAFRPPGPSWPAPSRPRSRRRPGTPPCRGHLSRATTSAVTAGRRRGRRCDAVTAAAPQPNPHRGPDPRRATGGVPARAGRASGAEPQRAGVCRPRRMTTRTRISAREGAMGTAGPRASSGGAGRRVPVPHSSDPAASGGRRITGGDGADVRRAVTRCFGVRPSGPPHRAGGREPPTRGSAGAHLGCGCC